MAVFHTGGAGFDSLNHEEAQNSLSPLQSINEPYSVTDFLDDQRRILKTISPESENVPCAVDRLEGRMVVLRVPHLSADQEARRSAAIVMKEKYGGRASNVLERFRIVQDFLVESCTRLDYAGLGRMADKDEICQEFIDYLLNFKIKPAHHGLPDDILDRFLDDWGHRWI